MRADALDDDVLTSENVVDASGDSVYKTESFPVCSAAYFGYVQLLRIHRSSFALYDINKDRFSAALTKLIFNGSSVSIPPTLATWSLIHNAHIDPSQNLGVISAIVSSAASSKLTKAP